MIRNYQIRSCMRELHFIFDLPRTHMLTSLNVRDTQQK